jgi:hypothetical protein
MEKTSGSEIWGKWGLWNFTSNFLIRWAGSIEYN